MANEWEREIDQLRAEMLRQFERVEDSLTEIKSTRLQEQHDRKQDRFQMKITLVAAGATIITAIVIQILRAVGVS